MRAGVSVPRKMRFVQKRSKFLAGQFFVDLFNLRRKPIVGACTPLTNEPSDLGIGFQRRADRLDPRLCFLGRDVR